MRANKKQAHVVLRIVKEGHQIGILQELFDMRFIDSSPGSFGASANFILEMQKEHKSQGYQLEALNRVLRLYQTELGIREFSILVNKSDIAFTDALESQGFRQSPKKLYSETQIIYFKIFP